MWRYPSASTLHMNSHNAVARSGRKKLTTGHLRLSRHYFDSTSTQAAGLRVVYLRFPRPLSTISTCLVLKCKNSRLFNPIRGKFPRPSQPSAGQRGGGRERALRGVGSAVETRVEGVRWSTARIYGIRERRSARVSRVCATRQSSSYVSGAHASASRRCRS